MGTVENMDVDKEGKRAETPRAFLHLEVLKRTMNCKVDSMSKSS